MCRRASSTAARSAVGSSAARHGLGLVEREDDRAREQLVRQQEPGGALVGRRTAVHPQERLVRTARPQQRRPARSGRARERARGQQPRGHVGTLDRAAEHHEVPGVVARRGRVGDPGDDGRALAHPGEVVVRSRRPHVRRQLVPGRVERLPQLGRDRLAGPPGVLPRRDQRPGDRRRREPVVRQHVEHVLAADHDVARLGGPVHHRQQRAAGQVLLRPGVLEQDLHVHVEQARRVVGTLDVPPDPEQRLRDPAQHAPPPPTRSTT